MTFETKFNGKKLGWTIVHFIFFLVMLFADVGVEEIEDALLCLALIIFFAWRFAENLGEAFA